MASFNSLVITVKGQALIAKMMAGTATPKFTKINCSEMDYSGYQVEQLQNIVKLSDVKQVEIISEVKRINKSEVKVSAVLTNSALDVGYYLKAIGLYAIDPEEGEVLYAIAVAITPDWIPSKALNVSSMSFDFITDVSNSENISLEVEPAAVATERQLELAKRNFAMASENNTEAIREAIPSGFTKFNDIDFSYGITNPNKIKLTGKGVAFVNGFKVVIPEGTVVDVGEPPTEGERDDLIFLEVWRAQETDTEGQTIQSRIRVVQGVDFDTYRLDGFAVSAIGVIGDNTGSHNNVHITAQGGLFAPITLNDSELWRTCFMSKYVRCNSVLGVTKTAIDDVGVYVAGQGDQTSRDALKTADGYVYAIPMFKVRRRNSGGYSVSNPNGAINLLEKTCGSNTSFEPPYAQPSNIVSIEFTEGYDQMLVNEEYTARGEGVYSFVVLSKDGNNYCTVRILETSVAVWSSVGVMWSLVNRNDVLYSDIIVDTDTIDLRHKVSLTGFNYQQLLEENFDKLLRGELQTKEKETMRKIYHGIPKTPIDANTVFYASFDGTTVAEIGGDLGISQISYENMFTGLGLVRDFYGTPTDIPKKNIGTIVNGTIDVIVRIKSPKADDINLILALESTTGHSLVLRTVVSGYVQWLHLDANNSLLGYSFFKLEKSCDQIMHIRATFTEFGKLMVYVNGKPGVGYSASEMQSFDTLSFTTIVATEKNITLSDLSISNIDRGENFATLPKDFIDGYADIAPTFSDQRRNYSDALTSQTTVGTATLQVLGKSSSGITPSKVGGTWANGDTIKVKGLGGEIISGVIDSDTALAIAYKAVENKIYLESVIGLSVGDTFTIANRTEYISTENFFIDAIDNVNKTIDINWSGQFDPAWIGAQGYYLILETTASTSSPVVKSMVESTLTAVEGTWSGLGTNEATFTIATSADLPIGDIEIQYSLNSASGNGVIPVFRETLGGEANGKKMSIGTTAVMDDFKGKVVGSIVENPNEFYVSWRTELIAPTDLVGDSGSLYQKVLYQPELDVIKKLDGAVMQANTNINGQIAQQVFSFNIIKMIEDKYGPIPSIDKISWIKYHLLYFIPKWNGFGKSPLGNKASLKVWYETNGTYVDVAAHTNGYISLLSHGTMSTGYVSNDGFLHLLVASDASDGIMPSTIYTDYVSLDIKLSPKIGYDMLVPINPRRDDGKAGVLLVKKETKEVESYFNSNENSGLVTYGIEVPYQGLTLLISGKYLTEPNLMITSDGTGSSIRSTLVQNARHVLPRLSQLPLGRSLKEYMYTCGEVTEELKIGFDITTISNKGIISKSALTAPAVYYYPSTGSIAGIATLDPDYAAFRGVQLDRDGHYTIAISDRVLVKSVLVGCSLMVSNDGVLYLVIASKDGVHGSSYVLSINGAYDCAYDIFNISGNPLIKVV